MMIKFNGSLKINEEVESCTHGVSYYRQLNISAIKSTDELIISEIYDEENKRAMVISGNQAKQLLRFLKQHVEDVEE